MKSIRRKIVEGRKGKSWHTYWDVRFDCGHWGLAPNIKGGEMPKTARCEQCEKAATKVSP